MLKRRILLSLASAVLAALLVMNRLSPMWWEGSANALLTLNRPGAVRAWLNVARISPAWPIKPDPAPPIQFSNASAEAGIQARHAQGACWGDYDNDGYPDLFVTTSGFGVEHHQSAGPARFHDLLYRNKGDGTFEDVSLKAGFILPTISQACAWGDLNNDGWIDIVAAASVKGNTVLYVNNGDGTFEQVEKPFDKKPKRNFTHGVALADYDADGWLDVYLAHSFDPFSVRSDIEGRRSGIEGNRGVPNELYKNLSGYEFKNVTEEANRPVGLEKGEAYAAIFFDSDRDGDQDLFVTNDYDEDLFYVNNGKSFENPTAIETNHPFTDGKYRTSCMGVSIGDFNNDLLPDIYCAQVGNDNLYKNLGGNKFEEMPDHFGHGWATTGLWGMGSTFADFDNDGDLDLFVSNGHSETFAAQRFVVLQNVGGRGFADVTKTAGEALRIKRHAEGLAWADYDRDGDVDLFVATDDDLGDSLLLRNDTNTEGKNWIGFRLRGRESNRGAIGASIVVRTKSGDKIRQRIAGSSMFSCNAEDVHFGLGAEDKINVIRVIWPNGKKLRLEGLPVNGYYDIDENQRSIPKKSNVARY